MAEALDIQDTTYSGTVASYMITRQVVAADTIVKGCAYVQDGIKKQHTIPRIEVADLFQPRQATPTSQGTVVVDSKVLVPQDMMMYYEFNPRDFEQHWYAEKLKPRLLDRDLPQTAEAFMLMQTNKRVNEFFEYSYHQSRIQYNPSGDNIDPTTVGATASAAPYFYFDGFIKKLLDDANTIQVGSPEALTYSNIRAKFQLALNLVPVALLFRYGAGGLKFMVSYVDKLKYDQSLREDDFKNQNTTEKAVSMYDGYDVCPCAGIPENTFYLAIAKPDTDSNLWVGINSAEDTTLQLQRLQNNSELFFVKGLFKMDTQIGFPDQFVLYTLQTANP